MLRIFGVEFSHLGGKYFIHFISFFAAVVILVCLFFFSRKQLRSSLQKGISVLIVVMVLRLFLLYNPFIWRFYKNSLTEKEVGWLNRDVLRIEYYKYFRYFFCLSKYCILGSSQVGYVFPPGLLGDAQVFTMSGLSPLGYLGLKDYFRFDRPEYIVLFISDLDMARFPDQAYLRTSLTGGFDLLKIFPRIFENKAFREKYSTKKLDFFARFIFAQIFPEWKFSFVFKGFLNKLKGYNYELKEVTNIELADVPAEVSLKEQLKNLTENHFEEPIPANLILLEEFVSFCYLNKIKVIILEGQYNPLAYTEKNMQLEKSVRNGITKLLLSYPNLVYIPREKLYQFTESDYLGGYHVNFQAAQRFLISFAGVYSDYCKD